MSTQKEIRVEIRGGACTIKTEGFQGNACRDATADLKRAIGTVESDENTPEWHQEEVRTIGH